MLLASCSLQQQWGLNQTYYFQNNSHFLFFHTLVSTSNSGMAWPIMPVFLIYTGSFCAEIGTNSATNRNPKDRWGGMRPALNRVSRCWRQNRWYKVEPITYIHITNLLIKVHAKILNLIQNPSSSYDIQKKEKELTRGRKQSAAVKIDVTEVSYWEQGRRENEERRAVLFGFQMDFFS